MRCNVKIILEHSGTRDTCSKS